MGKTDEEKQTVDCGACGSVSCYHMARKIALGVNIPTNCIVMAMETAKKEHEISLAASNQLAAMEKAREADERMRLMLDATPLGAKIWDSDFQLIDCNQESVNFFGVSSKQELLDGFFDFSPEYQADGKLSKVKNQEMFAQVLKDGKCVFEWMFRTKGGESLPAEVTLVRVDSKGEDLVISFTRDLREQRQMMQEIEQRDLLLETGSRVADILLSTDEEGDIETTIQRSMELIGQAVDLDHVQIWKNEVINDELHYVLAYQWSSPLGEEI